MKIQINAFFYLILLMCSSLNGRGQCSGVTLSTQLAVDNWLSANSWNCTIIDGDLTIGSVNSGGNSDIHDLSGFINFTEIIGDLIITYNNQLTSLNGLNNIHKIIGGLKIEYNSGLLNLEGLNGLTEINLDLLINENESLENLYGLNNLEIGYSGLTIENNPSLEDISALANLESPFGQMEISITNNDNLISLNGLQNISIASFFTGVRIIDNDALVDLTGLEGIDESFYLYIEDNDNLTSLNGINNLVGLQDGLTIRNNDALLNLDGMELQLFSGDPIMYNYGGIYIEDNEVLNDISGIQSYVDLTSDFIIQIKNNPNLSDCRSVSTCDYIDNGNTIIAENNAVGCNSNLEIETSCGNGSLVGQLTYDQNENCVYNVGDTLGLVGWKVFATSNNFTYFTFTDDAGNFEFDLIAGDYTLSTIPPNDNWFPCIDAQVYTIVDDAMLSTNLLSSYIANCPQLNVEISTPLMRRCFHNKFTVNWTNLGPPTAAAYIEVTPHFLFSDFSSSVPFTINANGNLEFFLDDLEVGASGEFTFYGLLSCDAMFDEIICNTAEIFPNEPCSNSINSNWSGANLFIDGKCENNTNHFFIKNEGQFGMNDSLEYRLYKNAVLEETISFQLSMGEELEIEIPADGNTYRLESNQVAFHPDVSTPSYTVEGCRLPGTDLLTGYFLTHPVEDYGESFSKICNPVIGSYDPNDKQGLPMGVGDDHVIERNQPIEYKIRFQNTGSDTAFNIFVLDTLSENFELNSLELGATSHPFQFAIIDDRVLQFSFDNIMLPDSNVNESGSHGYFKYTVQQKDGLPLGSSFENSASIYFDFNDPIKTNTTIHTLDIITVYDTLTIPLCQGDSYNNIVYTDDAFLYDTLLQEVFEYIDVTQVLVFEPDEVTIDTLIEEGAFYNGISYLQDTTIQEMLTNKNGCDSIVTTNILVQPIEIITIYDTLSISLCEGDLYNDIVYIQDAILYDTLNQGQFEYIDVTLIAVFGTDEITIDTLLQLGMTYNGIIPFADTTIQEVFTNEFGCDSIVSINISIQPVSIQNAIQTSSLEVKTFPNPFGEKITFQFSGANIVSGSLMLFDVIGKLITIQEFDEPIFELNKVPEIQGNYFYKIILDDQKVLYGKVIRIE